MTVTHPTTPGPPPRRSEEKWKTIGQVLAVVSGLLTVAASLLTLLTVNANREKSLAESTAADRGSRLTSAQQEISSLKQQTSPPATEASPTAAQTGGTVRHEGNVSIARDFTVDLDSPASDPQWGTTGSFTGKNDLSFNGRDFGYVGWSSTVKLPSSATSSYQSCREETGYENGRYALDDLAAGQSYCVKTSDGRFAAVRLTAVSATKVSFDVTTYEK
ncbi:Uncharacterised protein [Amycolatopsis camponoti]|uniref:Uncharacterized protein n=1 Tax=Amycolatopsis camponoti TaxID=2606593 RepID=A0A6I8LX92_9PSEU|nr:hypothetical protein [Amycolatopsis camponoti]VVJ19729.1 Uncharacterised protein [Amycolatopsis camponoti]